MIGTQTILVISYPLHCNLLTMLLRNIRSLKSATIFKRNKYTLPDLPYDYNALEPVISAEIMQIHHQKHHAAYVSNLNVSLEKFEEARVKDDLNTQVALQSQIKFNGGGNINHSIFWKNLCPPKDCRGEPTGMMWITYIFLSNHFRPTS